MTRRPDRAALLARRRALQQHLKKRARRLPTRSRSKRRLGLLALLALLLLLLLRRCSCTAPPPPSNPVEVELPTPTAAPRPTEKVARLPRPSFTPPPPEDLPWLDAFHMQVAARSPRLASCFEASDAPGALRWTTSVDPAHGRVSDHTLEPLMRTTLDDDQRRCVLEALSDPPYRLPPPHPSHPARVALVIEF